MGNFSIRMLFAWFASVLMLAGAPAFAQGAFGPGSTCHTFSSETADFAELAKAPVTWTCSSHGWSDRQPVAWIRFDLSEAGLPNRLTTRISSFEKLDVGLIGDRSESEWHAIDIDKTSPIKFGPRFEIPLPEIPVGTKAIVMRMQRPGNATILSEARLHYGDAGTSWDEKTMLLIAMLCGLLCAPLAFNIAFYLILRERFVLWHLAMVAGMLGYTAVSSGLINAFAAAGVNALAILNAAFFVLPVAAASMFSADFIERGCLSNRARFALKAAAVWSLVTALPMAIFQIRFYPFANTFYFLAFIPVISVYVVTMTMALRRGSRAVLFQIVGWTPIILVGIERIVRGLGLYGTELPLDQLIYLAVAIEILATALGVADRFMVIKRQRDSARSEAVFQEEQAERDPLTGLLNRRAIEPRFADLYAEGFDTMAVVDLDHFKQINDNHGHAKGDEVLRIAAKALMPDDDTLVIRMGGEEFLLLLRGSDASNRAERRRQAITTQIANKLPGLNRIVTASMGLVEQPATARVKPDFIALYSHCDRLLYEAKRTGRNRTMSERIRKFGKGPGRRTRKAA